MFRFSKQHLFFIFIFLVIIGILLGTFLNIILKEYSSDQNPDVFMSSIQQVTYNTDGSIKQRLNAQHLIHQSAQDHSTFTQPNITMHTKNNRLWHITAKKGYSLKGSKQVFLSGDVVFFQPGDAQYPSTRVTTENARLFPHQQQASTQRPARIQRPGTDIRCIGMNADFKKGIIHFHQQVKAIYDPPPTNS